MLHCVVGCTRFIVNVYICVFCEIPCNRSECFFACLIALIICKVSCITSFLRNIDCLCSSFCLHFLESRNIGTLRIQIEEYRYFFSFLFSFISCRCFLFDRGLGRLFSFCLFLISQNNGLPLFQQNGSIRSFCNIIEITCFIQSANCLDFCFSNFGIHKIVAIFFDSIPVDFTQRHCFTL